MSEKPSVLFVCIHNAGRSQMAAAYLTHLAGDRVTVLSAGSAPAEQINPVAVQAMAEDGIDITAAHPKILTNDAVRASDALPFVERDDLPATVRMPNLGEAFPRPYEDGARIADEVKETLARCLRLLA